MKPKITVLFITILTLIISLTMGCSTPNKSKFTGAKDEIKLMTIDPGHFHAALVQKKTYPQIDSNVFVYAPEGEDLDLHLYRIESFNKRENEPTNWKEIVYRGNDFMEKALAEKPGNLVVLAGNNKLKTSYIKSCIEAGLNVLADKPMVISTENFDELRQAFTIARGKNILLYDIMTERYEITNIIQKELIQIPDIFGRLEPGTPDDPSIIQESVHYFYKVVSGIPLVRPSWFFDVNQEGEGMVDVATHLVDLVQWECFPQQIINYEKEINIINARHWPTPVSFSDFMKVTLSHTIPDYLQGVVTDSILNIYSNGDITYKIKGVVANVTVKWDFENNEGHGDTHYSKIKGTKAILTIKQGKEEGYKPALYIEPSNTKDLNDFETKLKSSITGLSSKYNGLDIVNKGNVWEIIIPESFKVGHETHFGEVMDKFLHYLNKGELPDWEIPNMLAKYYTTTKALELARKNK